MTGLLLLLAIGLIVYSSLLVAFTYARLTRPLRRTYSWAVARSLPGDPGELTPSLAFERFEFDSRGNRLVAWDIAGLDPAGPMIVLTHGWSESKVVMLSRVSALAARSSRLIAWDLPGHGESGGTCALGLDENEDLETLVRLVRDEPGGRRIWLYGSSLGAGVSLEVGVDSHADIAGVIAEAPYRLEGTPAANVMRARGLAWRWNLPAAIWLLARLRGKNWYGFDRAKIAERMQTPLLVLWGVEDVVCPRADAEEIALAGRGTFVPIDGAGHNNMWLNDASREVAIAAIHSLLRN